MFIACLAKTVLWLDEEGDTSPGQEKTLRFFAQYAYF